MFSHDRYRPVLRVFLTESRSRFQDARFLSVDSVRSGGLGWLLCGFGTHTFRHRSYAALALRAGARSTALGGLRAEEVAP